MGFAALIKRSNESIVQTHSRITLLKCSYCFKAGQALPIDTCSLSQSQNNSSRVRLAKGISIDNRRLIIEIESFPFNGTYKVKLDYGVRGFCSRMDEQKPLSRLSEMMELETNVICDFALLFHILKIKEKKKFHISTECAIKFFYMFSRMQINFSSQRK